MQKSCQLVIEKLSYLDNWYLPHFWLPDDYFRYTVTCKSSKSWICLDFWAPGDSGWDSMSIGCRFTFLSGHFFYFFTHRMRHFMINAIHLLLWIQNFNCHFLLYFRHTDLMKWQVSGNIPAWVNMCHLTMVHRLCKIHCSCKTHSVTWHLAEMVKGIYEQMAISSW